MYGSRSSSGGYESYGTMSRDNQTTRAINAQLQRNAAEQRADQQNTERRKAAQAKENLERRLEARFQNALDTTTVDLKKKSAGARVSFNEETIQYAAPNFTPSGPSTPTGSRSPSPQKSASSKRQADSRMRDISPMRRNEQHDNATVSAPSQTTGSTGFRLQPGAGSSRGARRPTGRADSASPSPPRGRGLLSGLSDCCGL